MNDESELFVEAARSLGLENLREHEHMNCVWLYNRALIATDFGIEQDLREKTYIDHEIAYKAARTAMALDHTGEIMKIHHNPQWMMECAGVHGACEYIAKHAYKDMDFIGLLSWVKKILYCSHPHANDLLRAMLPAIKLRQYTFMFDVWQRRSGFAGLVCGWPLSDKMVDSILHHKNLKNLMEVANMFEREEVTRFQRAVLVIEKRWIAFNLALTHRALLDVCMFRGISGCVADLVCIHGMRHSPRAVELCQLSRYAKH